MKLIFLILLLIIQNAYAQFVFKAIVHDNETEAPLEGVNVQLVDTEIAGTTNIEGYVEIRRIPPGEYQMKISHIGYVEQIFAISFPNPITGTYKILLERGTEELEEIFVTTTRSSRLIDDEPTRVEVIAGEEIDEKITMDPSNISMLLNESTGILVQQTSAVSLNSVFRIQGLDGRYTQLLRDGLPLYGGFAGSLSIMQIPPLDLRQVEIIKGSASTLYGGGAIAGIINLVSKDPSPARELSFLLNGTSAKGFDGSGYFAQRFSDIGITFLSTYNFQQPYDNNNDGFSDLPEIRRYSLNPRVIIYSPKSKIDASLSFISEERAGGFIDAINSKSLGYLEINNTHRLSSRLDYSLAFNGSSNLNLRNGISYFSRGIRLPDYDFSGEQFSTYSEAVYSATHDNMSWLYGLNLVTENFEHSTLGYNDITTGAFILNNINFTEKLSLENGVRVDYNSESGWFPLPRVAMLYKLNPGLSFRMGGGLGYKIPSVFIEPAEEISFRNVLPLDRSNLNPERSFGVNFDFNYKIILDDEIFITLNQLFFYTRIKDPLHLRFQPQLNSYSVENIEGRFDSRGIETNLKFTFDHLKLFTGYTFNEVHLNNGTKTLLPLTPKHRLGIVLIYEEHGNYRIGLEGYYTGKQQLSSGEISPDFWITGIMVEKRFWGHSFFINFENILDVKQADYGPVFTGSTLNPQFTELFAPVEGRVINAGVKINL
jgi:outer membrane receptor for ferrienterochelin and colicins